MWLVAPVLDIAEMSVIQEALVGNAALELWRFPLFVLTYLVPFSMSGPRHRFARDFDLACCSRVGSGT